MKVKPDLNIISITIPFPNTAGRGRCTLYRKESGILFSRCLDPDSFPDRLDLLTLVLMGCF